MKTLLSLAAAGLLAASCAPMPDPAPPMPPSGDLTQCKADKYQSYVGRRRPELPTRPSNETWRVVCTSCPMTMDYNPNRLNIIYHASTDVITEVKCG